jgi:crossover junction endodeoxyribonuclease RusA
MSLTFTVPGTPAPQNSQRHVGPWRQRVTLFAYQAAKRASRTVTDTAVDVYLAFVLPRPVSTPIRHTPQATRRPDLETLVQAVLEAFTGVLVADDSQVVSLKATKRLAELGEQPGLTVTITGAEQ